MAKALKTKYSCGHEDEYTPLTNESIINAFVNWGEVVAVGGDTSMCFRCFYRRKNENKI